MTRLQTPVIITMTFYEYVHRNRTAAIKSVIKILSEIAIFIAYDFLTVILYSGDRIMINAYKSVLRIENP